MVLRQYCEDWAGNVYLFAVNRRPERGSTSACPPPGARRSAASAASCWRMRCRCLRYRRYSMFRNMRRGRQALPEAESLAILARGSHGVLAVLGDEGWPYAVPLNYLWHEGSLYFHCARAGHKYEAVKACPRCVLLRRGQQRGRTGGLFDGLPERHRLRPRPGTHGERRKAPRNRAPCAEIRPR